MDKIWKYLTIGLMAALVALAVYGFFAFRSRDATIAKLMNDVAIRDVTIEVQKGVFTKLTQQLDDVKIAIDQSTTEGKALTAELKKNKAELLAVTNALIQLREQVAKGQGTQTDVPGTKPGDPTRKKVTFGQDFGYARVDGFTLTDPPEYELKLGQGSKPLKLELAIAQQKDKSWRTYVTSSDPNVGIDIGVTAVNPYILESSWYEKIKVHADLGVGNGVLGGVGAAYQFGQFDVGPSIWGVTMSGGGVFYGINFSWAPFKSTSP
jgi:hypothetical protein